MSAKKDASSPASHEVSMASSGNRRLSAHEQHMKHIIHDANHCLMLIAIAGDQIERHIGQGQLTPDEGEGQGRRRAQPSPFCGKMWMWCRGCYPP